MLACRLVFRQDCVRGASVITIQSVMLVALGFLLATLIALVLAPAYRTRAMRLTYRQIRRTLPLTESEVRVDQDRLRAQYAVRIHDLETKLEKARLTAARQQVEVNRRDAIISNLEAELAQLRADLEQNVNARRVLEQTIMDRLPAVEQRLADTRALLEQRDRELAAVTSETGKTIRALDEVMQINAQQRAEIERLNAAIATRSVRTRVAWDGRAESEVALRAELEALRAKTRDQESLISRLQALVSGPETRRLTHVNGKDVAHDQDAELERLRRDLAEAENALKSVSEENESERVADDALMSKLQSMDAIVEEQASTIRRLVAALSAYEKGENGTRSISLKDSKIAMKARIAALQAEVQDQASKIEKLRAELASANERLALQSAQFMEEMRQLRTGAPAVATVSRRQASSSRRSLAERIKEVNPAIGATIRSVPARSADRQPSPSTEVSAEHVASPRPADDAHEAVTHANGSSLPPPLPAQKAVNEPEATPKDEELAGKDSLPQSRLLDRIASLGKP